MTEAEELRPVPRERAILESFFTQLGMFSFDRAKDYVEKEKDNSKSAGAIWAALLAALAHLAAAEKAYHNMTFLGQKMGNIDVFYRKVVSVFLWSEKGFVFTQRLQKTGWKIKQ